MALSIRELKEQALARQQEADLKVQREAQEKEHNAAQARANREQAQRQTLEKERQARIQAAARHRAEQAKLEKMKASLTEDFEGAVSPLPPSAASQAAFHAKAAKLMEKKQPPSRLNKIRNATANRPGPSRPRPSPANKSEPRPSAPRSPRSQPIYDKPDLTREEKRKLKLRRELMGGPKSRGESKSGVSALARAAGPPSARRPARPKAFAPAPRPTPSSRNGINGADFLPGAPVRPEVLETARRKELAASAGAKRGRAEDTVAGLTKKKAKAEPAAPPRKETARERFIREEAERKARRAEEPERLPDQPESDEEGYDDEDSEADSFIDDDGPDVQDQLHEVLGAFRRGRAPVRYDEEDSDSDMEAGAFDVNREELRSARLAKEEDLREQELEERHAEEKARRKKMLDTIKARKR